VRSRRPQQDGQRFLAARRGRDTVAEILEGLGENFPDFLLVIDDKNAAVGIRQVFG